MLLEAFLYVIGVVLCFSLCMLILQDDLKEDGDMVDLFIIMFLSIFSWFGVIAAAMTIAIIHFIDFVED